MMYLLPTIGYCMVAALLFLTFIFAVARLRNRYDLIDVAWGLAFIAIAAVSYLSQPTELYSIQTITTVLVVVWGLRLSLHIYSRWDKSQAEDKRYTELRNQYAKKWGGFALNMYVRVFLLQAVLAVAVSLPLIVINTSNTTTPSWVIAVGIVVWVIGFYFEAVGDYQLKKHIANPKNKGKIMTSGLWEYTRHPNYFGELTQWWGIFVIALAVPYVWVSVIGPIIITVLLLFISGVPLTEKHFKGRAGWDAYKKHTSKLFPLPPR